jgi:hypothetical protein
MTSTTATAVQHPAVERYDAAIAALAELPTGVADVRELSESVLLRINDLHAKASRVLGAAGALIAGEVAYRSRPALGMSGLAQRTGFRTPERLITQTTGATKQEVLTALTAGKLIAEIADDGRVDKVTGEVLAPTQPWLRPVAVAVSSARISPSISPG